MVERIGVINVRKEEAKADFKIATRAAKLRGRVADEAARIADERSRIEVVVANDERNLAGSCSA